MLDRASRGWRGFTVTANGLRLLQDLRRSLLQPPTRLQPRTDTGRHDNDYRYGRSPRLKGDFSSYLPRFFYDTVLFNPDMLEFLATKVPMSHLMLASDYPFAEKQPVEYVRRARKISKKDQDAILGANAAKLFGVSI